MFYSATNVTHFRFIKLKNLQNGTVNFVVKNSLLKRLSLILLKVVLNTKNQILLMLSSIPICLVFVTCYKDKY
jgi:hypothetical protein